MKKIFIVVLLWFFVTSCAFYTTAPTVNTEVEKAGYSVEHGVLIELKIKTIDKAVMEGHFLRSIALRGHDMSAMTTENHEHGTDKKDSSVNLLDELVKYGCLFKTEFYTSNQRLLVKKDTALFVCKEKNYFVDGELVDTHGVRGGALSLTKGDHVYFKIK